MEVLRKIGSENGDEDTYPLPKTRKDVSHYLEKRSANSTSTHDTAGEKERSLRSSSRKR